MSSADTDARSPSRRGLLERLDRRLRRTVARPGRQRVLAILGMHRSGTSNLAGSLEQAGLYLGGDDVEASSRWNAKGNRESRMLSRLHEGLLESNGGDWRHPPAHVHWDEQAKRARDRFIRSRSSHAYWGFKDPRAVFLVEGWLEVLPEMGMVATVRHPAAVAESLRRRHPNKPPEDWLALWLRYNQRLLELQQTHGFAIIDFDLAPDAYLQRLETLTAELGLQATEDHEPFFDPALRSREDRHDAELPAEVDEVYRELTMIAARQAAKAGPRSGSAS